MKRVFEIVILLAILGLAGQIVFGLFKNEHSVNYNISSDKNVYSISEIYKNGLYHFKVELNKKTFSFIEENIHNKQKRIIEDIEFMDNDNIICIYPVYKNKTSGDIVCNKNNMTYSYYAVKDNDAVKDFVTKLQKQNYTSLAWYDTDKNIRNLDNLKLYQSNLSDTSRIYVWKYNGFYTINKNGGRPVNIFNRDIYSNNLMIVYNNNYIIPDYNSKFDFNKLLIYDMTDDMFKTIIFEEKISYDSYFNGIVKDKLYLFDRENLVQYEIRPSKKTYSVVGNKELNALYYNNGVWETKNIYDFVSNKIYFKDDSKVPSELKNTTYYKSNNIYYYLDGNKLCSIDILTNVKKIHFEYSDINNVQLVNNSIYFLKGDTLYIYNDSVGIKRLVKYSEFNFNKVNMYSVYAK